MGHQLTRSYTGPAIRIERAAGCLLSCICIVESHAEAENKNSAVVYTPPTNISTHNLFSYLLLAWEAYLDLHTAPQFTKPHTN